ncbi:hypothetical protein L914_21446 [Phytophthora nicotianae]|uniref:Uncharacterized protein n=1 Tax=Phytophthora nicotianae TaxID=4792 RepID=W2M5U9_PHYNI|nr:hypothetical protein L914_21446 [Phytophthora nicotianae]
MLFIGASRQKRSGRQSASSRQEHHPRRHAL